MTRSHDDSTINIVMVLLLLLLSAVVASDLWTKLIPELWKIELLPLITSASDVFCGFPTWTTLPMQMYVSEPALHCSCCRSSKQDGSTSLGTWHGWATRVTCPGLYIRQFAGYPRIGGAAQDVRVTPGFGPWKQTFSRSIMA